MTYTDSVDPSPSPSPSPTTSRPRPASLLRPALVGFVIAYLAINAANSALTLAYTVIADTPSSPELGVSYLYDPAYQATVGWHPLIALVLSTAAATWTFRRLRARGWTVSQALAVGTVWLLVNAALDAVIYVALLGDTRWGLPAHDFYIAGQPWIALTYVALFAGPLLARGVQDLRRPRRSVRPSGWALRR